MIEAAREAVIVIEAEMRITAANRTAHAAFGKNLNLRAGRRLSEVFRDPSLHEAFTTALRGRKAADISLEMITERSCVYDVHIEPLSIDGNDFALAVFYDRTKLEHLERVRQEFLSNISHELRTPLTSILASVETLDDGGVDDQANNRRFLAIIRRNAERMHLLISDILELAQIESGQVFINRRNASLSRIVDDIFADLTAAAAARGVVLINEVGKDRTVYADPARLEQILANLIDNAIKFNNTGGSVTVRHSLNGTRSVIEVRDTGSGIPYGVQQRIFERFYRGDRSRARQVGGTGLGLAIVKHLTHLHGGDVSVTSVPGEGAAFYIGLPFEKTFNSD